MRVIGTAGHVDHGKSTLVRRLTGMDPDRLAEEKARSLTIDLGFAWLERDNGEILGIIDVPGHRDFIENMLAGVGGIDAVILVIAADEGVMPQTREHLAILDLLDVNSGFIVLTKIDLIDDPDWLELVEMDIRDVVAETQLQDADIIRVSAHTGVGIDDLLSKIEQLLTTLPPNPDINQPRLPVDRVFTMSGFGTVVTGTLSGGALHLGDEVEFQPSNKRGRIRGLQSYQQSLNVVYPGSRVAVNVAGVNRDEVRRGDVLASPDLVHPTKLIDAFLRYLDDAGKPLKHNAQVKLFSGAAETLANVRLLSDEQLLPGQEGWLQLRLEDSIPVSGGDRYILRYPSPPQTIGGGVIVDPHPSRRWRRFRKEIIERLETQLSGSPIQRVVQVAQGREPVKKIVVQQSTGYNDDDLESVLNEAVDEGLLVEVKEGFFLATASLNLLVREIEELITAFHADEPLRTGMPREVLRSHLQIKGTMLTYILDMQINVIAEGSLLRHRDHQVTFDADQQAQVDRLMQVISTNPYMPPSLSEATDIVGADVMRALIDRGEIVHVQPEVIFTRLIYDEMVAGILEIIDRNGQIDAKTLRDRFGTSRKFAIGLLEYLDTIGVTRRNEGFRVRGRT